ncbi:MAG TPA: hypothetical protein ENJ21_03230 [Chromatiaceae bacterium]|nr:hypothetical protein [Chromatiaceae bacterium]
MRNIIIDEDSTSLRECFAVIKTPRRNRQRFPEGNVRIMPDEASALAQADETRNLHAARVYGPSPSSENVRIYYLVGWL